MDLAVLGALLRARRDLVRPADVGLPGGRRRNVPGLRRAEVARLAGTSTSYYAALEQGAGPRPSGRTLSALAQALRLGEDDDAHCRDLAARPAPEPGGPEVHVPPDVLHLLVGLAATPAQVLTDRQLVVAENRLAALAFRDRERAGLTPAGQPARLVVQHDVVGQVELDRRSLRVCGAGLRLVWYTAPGTDADGKLALLSVIGSQVLAWS